MSIYWASLEHRLDDFLSVLTPLERGHVAEAVTGNADLRSKLQMVRALAFVRQPKKEWFDFVSTLLDFIDNDIRPRRNDHIHGGVFTFADGKIVRRIQKTKLRKPQAFQITLSTLEKIPVRIAEMRKLCADIDRAASALFMLRFNFEIDAIDAVAAAHFSREPPPWPSTLSAQYLRQAESFARRGKKRSAPERPPGSSQT